jgi:hypothetical protein
MPRLFGYADKAVHRLTPMAWPSKYKAGAQPADLFAMRIAACMDDTAWVSLKELAEAFSADEGVTVLTCTVFSRIWTSDGNALFEAWLQFWSEWPDVRSGRALVAALTIKYMGEPSDELVRSALDRATFPDRVAGTILPELRPIERVDVENWVYHRDVRAFCGTLEPAEWIRHVERLYASETHIPMEILADHLREMLASHGRVA